LSAEDRKLAVRSGLIAEEWAHRTATSIARSARSSPARSRSGSPPACCAPRASPLYTQAGRWAFGMEFLGHLTDLVGKSFDELDPRAAAGDASPRDRRRHLGSDQEGAARGAQAAPPGCCRPNVEDQLAGDRLLQMIQTETDYAVPVPDIRTRALMNRFPRAGRGSARLRARRCCSRASGSRS
jgi:hypothetical protein